MQLPKYQLKAENTLMVFEFTSEGPKGQIHKLIKFSATNLKGLYNLSFGNKDANTGGIDDLAISNNGDSEKILSTVVSAIYAFTEQYPNSWVYAKGSTKSRTRLYRMGITKYLQEINKDFDLYGLNGDRWEPFKKDKEYEAFFSKRKKS